MEIGCIYGVDDLWKVSVILEQCKMIIPQKYLRFQHNIKLARNTSSYHNSNFHKWGKQGGVKMNISELVWAGWKAINHVVLNVLYPYLLWI